MCVFVLGEDPVRERRAFVSTSRAEGELLGSAHLGDLEDLIWVPERPDPLHGLAKAASARGESWLPGC